MLLLECSFTPPTAGTLWHSWYTSKLSWAYNSHSSSISYCLSNLIVRWKMIFAIPSISIPSHSSSNKRATAGCNCCPCHIMLLKGKLHWQHCWLSAQPELNIAISLDSHLSSKSWIIFHWLYCITAKQTSAIVTKQFIFSRLPIRPYSISFLMSHLSPVPWLRTTNFNSCHKDSTTPLLSPRILSWHFSSFPTALMLSF